METDLIVPALLRIHRFVPSALLPSGDIGELPLDELIDLLARARYLERAEEELLASAIAMAFNGEGGDT